MNNNYVLNHDFGYGQGQAQLKKLALRNVDDLVAYVKSIIDITFVAKINDFCITFDNFEPVRVFVETL